MQLETVNIHALETALTVAGMDAIQLKMVRELTHLLTNAEQKGYTEGLQEGSVLSEEYLEQLEVETWDAGFDAGFNYGSDYGELKGYTEGREIALGNSDQPDVFCMPDTSGYESDYESSYETDEASARELLPFDYPWECGVCTPDDETCAAVNCLEGRSR